MTKHHEILSEINNGFGIITLNRPKALNALSLDMIADMRKYLKDWEKKPFVHSVIIKSSDVRGFCAGGDVKIVAENAKTARENSSNARLATQFFKEEYLLNAQISAFKKPYISFINGIVMGGGNGISLHGSHRIVTENTKFAMPETKIGFFPDVGSMNILTKCPGYAGLFLGLTGNTITGKKILDLGLATHFIPIKNWDNVQDQILIFKNADEVLKAYKYSSEKYPDQEKIDKYFSLPSVEHILKALEENQENDNWCRVIYTDLKQRCPTSLKVTFKHYHLAKQAKTINEILKIDYRLSQNMSMRKDFYEGVRALLIDKTGNPEWFPNNIYDVKNEDIEIFFNSCLNGESDLTIST